MASLGSDSAREAGVSGPAALRRSIAEVLDPLVTAHPRCALLDFPSSANVGDNAIWLGEVQYLTSRGMRPVYRCDRETYAEPTLRKRLGEGIILLHGGGNLGDVWEGSQELRETIISNFPSNPIVVLPQTIHFRERTNLLRAKKIFDGHGGLTIVTRSQRSYQIAKEEFACNTLLAPDMAFFMNTLAKKSSPSTPILWLQRTDQESGGLPVPTAPDVKQVDWVELGRVRQASVMMSRAPHLRAAASFAKTTIRTGMRALSAPLGKTFDARAEARLARGVALLSEGQVVITDRLHGHILCLMMEIPHVLLDNSYGKLRDFYETWTKNETLVKWASSPEEALAVARDLCQG